MNFEFISQFKDLDTLYKCCRESEAFVGSKPDISITAARKAMEFIVKLLYGSAINSEIKGLTLFDMLSDPDFVAYIDDRKLIDSIHFIRKKGNQSVHQGNMNIVEAFETLEYLHFVAGEVCIFLGLIDKYPIFSQDIINNHDNKELSMITDEPQVDPMLIKYFSPRLHSVRNYSELRNVINVHADPRKMSGRGTVINIDSGANTKTAFYLAAAWLSKMPGVSKIAADYVKSTLSFIIDGRSATLAVKTGCSVLGYRVFGEQWDILPGIDFILYAPNLNENEPVVNQLRVFTRDEFMEMWEYLNLVRYKVSGAALKKHKLLLGDSVSISIDKYADIISVQSFSNSKKKELQIYEYLQRIPVLTMGGYEKLKFL